MTPQTKPQKPKLRIWLPMLGLCFILYAFSLYSLVQSGKTVDELSGNTLQVPDLKVAPSESYLQAYLNSIGSEGRQLYHNQMETEDFVYPFTYSLFFGLLLVFLAKWVKLKKKGLVLLSLFFPLGAFFDFIENRLMMHMIDMFPKNDIDYATLYQVASASKWGSIGIGMLSIATLLLVYLSKKLRS